MNPTRKQRLEVFVDGGLKDSIIFNSHRKTMDVAQSKFMSPGVYGMDPFSFLSILRKKLSRNFPGSKIKYKYVRGEF